ncbi:MAG TPA: CPBP family glutamic-type intramembrane protease [Bacillota bacterium]|nr:CPBP family glutamic-type intramembrane protease [Bacillota bacterium]HRS20843.1 CPBP family glutamic-type intramembrane protease [Clostridia bacterium]HOS69304.1 CPBP family glutamic-type intramembrane protease [Bacillota bacterium]HQE65280.1 CPBP family glutamic-type intramembrane protease [Bacillota bacterium]HQI15541.1 CPBP family glutamic-type intramembrane protease [Bacillota bacterium]
MRIIPENIYKEMEKNIYEGISLSKSAIVLFWAFLCLYFAYMKTSYLYTVFFGILFYASLLALCLLLFKDIKRYLSFPKGNKILPRFIGYKPDIIFIYPIFLMSLIGAINNLLIASGIFPEAVQKMSVAVSDPVELFAKIVALPLVTFTEELINLFLVSLAFNKMKFLGNFRLIISILLAALTFGILHSIGWGLKTAILIGISYIPVFFTTLYTGNIWISFLAHFYNNFISLFKSYYGNFHFVIVAAICLIPFVWAIKAIVRKNG